MNWNKIINHSESELNENESQIRKNIDNCDLPFLTDLFEDYEVLEQFLNYSNESHNAILIKLINNKNFFVFSNTESVFVKKIAVDFYNELNPSISGTLNLENKSVKIEDSRIKNFIKNIIIYGENEINELIKYSHLIKEIPVIIELSSQLDSIIIKKVPNKSFLNKSILISSMMMSLSSFAESEVKMDDSDAFNHTFKAMMSVPKINKFVDENKREIANHAKNLAKNLDSEEALAVIGVLSKAGIEQKLSHKGRLSREVSDALDLGKINYKIEVSFDGTVSGEIEGKNPYIENSTYNINAETGHETLIQLDLKIAFD